MEQTSWPMNDEYNTTVLKITCHPFIPDRFGLHQDFHRKGVRQRNVPSCHSDGESHPWLLLVYRPQGTVLSSCLSAGREYLLVNGVKRKAVTPLSRSVAWMSSSLLAVLSNLLGPFRNQPLDFKEQALVNLLNYSTGWCQCLRRPRPKLHTNLYRRTCSVALKFMQCTHIVLVVWVCYGDFHK